MLRIQTFGTLAVTRDGQPVAGAAAQPRRLALLALLARAGDRGVGRDRLVALLWPDVEQERARRNLTHALYALRRDLGDEEAIQGARELRLDPERMGADVRDLLDALAQGRLAHAVSLYAGPFLDGFRLPGVPAFERWAEEERAALQHRHLEALETLARRSADAAEALGWWRRLAGHDPLNARYAIGLMEALTAAGDVPGALRHARVHETLVAEELDLPPDREVVALAERLRSGVAARADDAAVSATPGPVSAAERPPEATAAEASVTAASAVEESLAEASTAEARAAEAHAWPAAPAVVPATVPPLPAATPLPATTPLPPTAAGRPHPRARWSFVALGAGVALAAAALVGLGWGTSSDAREPAPGAPGADTAATPVLAVGRIADRRSGDDVDLAGSLADMLATNLAHGPAVRVVSTVRMYELARQLGGDDTSAAALLDAARRAGATELVDGALYTLADGTLRLDLRRVELASGEVRAALSVRGADPFALADSGTAALLAALGAPSSRGSIAAVTTASLAAYRLYEQGLRAWSRGAGAEAASLFEAALVEDSTFALAAYYHAQSSELTWPESVRAYERAVRLAARASERERLLIRAGWARKMVDLSLAALAESLVTRYPDEVIGYLSAGEAALIAGRMLEAVPLFERVVAMDSLRLATGIGSPCAACDALQGIVIAYQSMDSLPAAERQARRWARLQPESPAAWQTLAVLQVLTGRVDEALESAGRAAAVNPRPGGAALLRVRLLIQAGQGARAAALAEAELPTASASQRAELLWLLAIALRESGRLDDALAVARRYRQASAERASPGSAAPTAFLEGAVLLDRGEARAAAALFDSVSRWLPEATTPSSAARSRSWALAQVATALAQAGDTVRLARLVDSVRAVGARSGFGRDRVLHHYVRGLLLAARGEWGAAEAEQRRALLPPVGGYSRVHLELARALAAQGRREEARAVLQAALRGPFDGSGLYVSQRELRRRLEALDAPVATTPVAPPRPRR